MNGEPETYRNWTPDTIVGRYVRVRPYYHSIVQNKTGRFRRDGESRRYPWTERATVMRVYRNDMVVVRFMNVDGFTNGPWQVEAAHFPRELHDIACRCPACLGDGIHELRGA